MFWDVYKVYNDKILIISILLISNIYHYLVIRTFKILSSSSFSTCNMLQLTIVILLYSKTLKPTFMFERNNNDYIILDWHLTFSRGLKCYLIVSCLPPRLLSIFLLLWSQCVFSLALMFNKCTTMSLSMCPWADAVVKWLTLLLTVPASHLGVS